MPVSCGVGFRYLHSEFGRASFVDRIWGSYGFDTKMVSVNIDGARFVIEQTIEQDD